MLRLRALFGLLIIGLSACKNRAAPQAPQTSAQPQADNVMTQYVETRVDDMKQAQATAEAAVKKQAEIDKQLQSTDNASQQ